MDDNQELDKVFHFLLKDYKRLYNKDVIFKLRFTSLKSLKLGTNLSDVNAIAWRVEKYYLALRATWLNWPLMSNAHYCKSTVLPPYLIYFLKTPTSPPTPPTPWSDCDLVSMSEINRVIYLSVFRVEPYMERFWYPPLQCLAVTHNYTSPFLKR